MFNINQRLSVCTIGYLLLQLAIQTNVNEKTSRKMIPLWEELTWGIGYEPRVGSRINIKMPK